MHKTSVVGRTYNSLDDLRLTIEQREARLGELLAVSAYQPGPGDPLPAATWLTIARAAPPDKRIEVDELVGDNAPSRAGFELVCIGEALIGARLVSMAVYRAL